MKNLNFYDPNQKTVIKVLSNQYKLERELIGVKVFSGLVSVPEVLKIDNQTLKINFLESLKADKADAQVINNFVLEMFKKVNKFESNEDNLSDFTLPEEINNLLIKLVNYPLICQSLLKINKNLSGKKLYPVHGDLQKQNIFISESGIELIDFEHFIFAPQELEIVNSLFFNDSNCLNMNYLLPILKKLFDFTDKVIIDMLTFYAINQFVEGRSKKEVVTKFKRAIEKLKKINPVKDTNFVIPNFELNKTTYWTASSCFA